jgi:cytidylate kinase
MKKYVTVAIDGPAGAGKSTVAREVAMRLGYALVDTGAVYRSVALLAQRQGVAEDNDTALEALVGGLHLQFKFEQGVNHVWVHGEDVTSLIRTPDISQKASRVSARPVVRKGLLELQRRMASVSGAVLEGRDIGTVVCPNAEVKIFLSASPEERARRRFAQLQAQGSAVTYEEVLKDQNIRDAQDTTRQAAPLKAAEDACVLDSTSMSVEEVTQFILNKVGGVLGGVDKSKD